MNKALAMASGDYYLVLGADDRPAPQAIEQYRNAIDDCGADIISACIRVGEVTIRPGRGAGWLYGQAGYVSGHSVGTLIRKGLHSKFGYYSRRFPIAADQYFLKRAIGGGASVAVRDFVAGEYSLLGLSSVDTLGTLCEIYRIQMETEKAPVLQTGIFILRLLKNFRAIAARAGAAPRT
jgi:glycosyltransferase involved in cell wall biosynthesis